MIFNQKWNRKWNTYNAEIYCINNIILLLWFGKMAEESLEGISRSSPRLASLADKIRVFLFKYSLSLEFPQFLSQVISLQVQVLTASSGQFALWGYIIRFIFKVTEQKSMRIIIQTAESLSFSRLSASKLKMQGQRPLFIDIYLYMKVLKLMELLFINYLA